MTDDNCLAAGRGIGDGRGRAAWTYAGSDYAQAGEHVRMNRGRFDNPKFDQKKCRDPDIRAMLRLDGDEAEEEHEFDNDANDEARQDAETFLDDDFMAQLMQKEDDDGQGEDEAFDFDKVRLCLL